MGKPFFGIACFFKTQLKVSDWIDLITFFHFSCLVKAHFTKTFPLLWSLYCMYVNLTKHFRAQLPELTVPEKKLRSIYFDI